MKEIKIRFKNGDDVLVSNDLEGPGVKAVFNSYKLGSEKPFGVAFRDQTPYPHNKVIWYKYCWRYYPDGVTKSDNF